MSSLINAAKSDAGHWYTPDGEPFYEIECATKPGTFRPVTLRDARKLNLYPSVTSVLGIVANKGLDRWKIEQAILSAVTLPRLESETADDFARRVSEDMWIESRRAMDFGSRLHAAIERWVADTEYDADDEIMPFIEAFAKWYNGHKFELFDAVVDFKTQGKDGWDDLVFYDEWCWQLAAYDHALGKRPASDSPVVEASVADRKLGFGGRVDFYWQKTRGARDLVSVAISSKAPGHIASRRWTAAEATEGLLVFKAALNLWKLVRGYDPTKVKKCKAVKVS